jgi:Protein of unknown function DUF72
LVCDLSGRLQIVGGNEEERRQAKEWAETFLGVGSFESGRYETERVPKTNVPIPPTLFDRQSVAQVLSGLAAKGVFLGTSSWKYPGWRGQIYDENRYITRGKFAESRFERECLTEYAETFKTVCVDAAYYRFPDHRYLEGMMSQVPDDFRFVFRVTDEVTIKKFTKLPRFGDRAGKPNENFLNADLFGGAFVRPFEPFRQKVGLFMFVRGHSKPARDGRMKTSHFESGIAHKAVKAALMRNEPTHCELATLNRYTGGQRLVVQEDRARAGRRS